MTDTNTAKKMAFETILNQGMTRVMFDMNDPDVQLPVVARSVSGDGRHLMLDFSKNFVGVKTVVSDTGVWSNLSFGGQTHPVFVSWSSVRSIMQGGVTLESWDTAGSEIPTMVADDDETLTIRIDKSMRKWISQTIGMA